MAGKYDRERARFPREGGKIGPIVEEREQFVIRVVLRETADEARVTSFRVNKTTWTEWWAGIERDLDEMVEAYLADVESDPRPMRAIIVPHAGLIYSGRCAAQVFGQVEFPPVVVILAPNHSGIASAGGASLWSHGAFETPLGPLEIAEDFAAAGVVLFAGGDGEVAAIDELERVLSASCAYSPPLVRADPLYDPLRDHPRFQALLAKYDQPAE